MSLGDQYHRNSTSCTLQGASETTSDPAHIEKMSREKYLSLYLTVKPVQLPKNSSCTCRPYPQAKCELYSACSSNVSTLQVTTWEPTTRLYIHLLLDSAQLQYIHCYTSLGMRIEQTHNLKFCHTYLNHKYDHLQLSRHLSSFNGSA